MRDWSQILDRFPGLREDPGRSGYWFAFCPYHKGGQETTRSLRLWLSPGGHLWLRCYACGDERKADILASVGLEMKDLFDDGPEKGHDEDKWKKSRVAAVYDYKDESGVTLYQQWRYEPKRFFPHRVEGGKPKPGLGDVRRVVYRIPELLQHKASSVVFVAEGERKADLLWSWGLPATCNVSGVGMGWLPEYSLWLVDHFPKAGFVVLPDNDPPGRRHAAAVLGSLLLHGAHGVACLQIPNLPEKGDVVDFADQGGTKEKLLEILAETPRWKRVTIQQ